MKIRLLSALLGAAVSLSVLTGGSYASKSYERYIVRVSGADVGAVAGAISETVPDAEITYRYERLIKGLAVRMSEDDADKVEALYGVSSVRRSALYLMDDEKEAVTGAEDGSEAEAEAESDAENDTESESDTGSESGTEIEFESDGGEDITPADTGYTGAGQVIAVLDCGFNVSDPHFALSDAVKSAAKISESDVKEAELNAPKANYVSEKIPFAYDYFDEDTDLMPTSSHGMNVAALIGADGRELDDGYVGIAPDCQLLLMKVFDDTGDFAYEESILAALEDAYALGADIVNLSFGSACGDDTGAPIGIDVVDAVKMLCENGVSVVCSAGNSGRSGDLTIYDDVYGINDPTVFMPDNGTIASPASLPGVTAVGSYATVGYFVPVIKLGDGSELEYSDTSGDYFRESFIRHFDGQALEYVVIDGIGTEEDIAAAGDLEGKLAVIMRGEITFSEKCANAAAAGAVGVIIINTEQYETVMMDLSDSPIPAISVTGEGGELLMSSDKKAVYIALGTFSSAGERTDIEYNPASSWGPTPELGLKPDVIAPGYHIGTLGLGGEAEYLDGTSISAAFVSGYYALLGEKLSAEGIDSAELKKTILMNSAVTMTGDRESSYSPASFSPRAQGAGMVDSAVIAEALTADTLITPYSLSLGDGLGRQFEMEITVTNDSDTDKRYLVTAEVLTDHPYTAETDDPDEDLPMFLDPRALGIPASVRLGGDTSELNFQSEKYDGSVVTIKAGASMTLTVNVKLPGELYDDLMAEMPYGRFIDGYICLDDLGPSGGAPQKVYSVPFMGYMGSWSDAPAFDGFVYGEAPSAYYGSYMYGDIYYDGVYDSAVIGGSAAAETDYIPELCVFSPNADENMDYVMMHLDMLRCAKDCRYTIYNPDGKAIYSVTNEEMLYKTHLSDIGELISYDFYLWDGSAEDNEYYIYPDGLYTVVFEFFMYDGSVQTETLNLRIDTEVPIILEREIIGEGGDRKLRLTVSDDFALDFIDIYCLVPGETPEEDYDDSLTEEEETPEEDDLLEEWLEELDEYEEESDEPEYTLNYYDSVILHDESGYPSSDAEGYTVNEDGSITVELDIGDVGDISKLYIYVYDYALNRCVDMIRFWNGM